MATQPPSHSSLSSLGGGQLLGPIQRPQMTNERSRSAEAATVSTQQPRVGADPDGALDGADGDDGPNATVGRRNHEQQSAAG